MYVEPISPDLESKIRNCQNERNLALYLKDERVFVRVLAAWNPRCTGKLLDLALSDNHKGVVLAALQNQNLTKVQYDEAYDRITREIGFCAFLWSELAGHVLADWIQMGFLLQNGNGCVILKILNTPKDRTAKEFHELIEPFAPSTFDPSTWTLTEKLVHFRLTGNKFI